jgi:hypothetical protein
MRRSYGARRAPKVRVWTNPDVDPLAPHLLGSRRPYIHCVYDQDSDSLKTPASRTNTLYSLSPSRPSAFARLSHCHLLPLSPTIYCDSQPRHLYTIHNLSSAIPRQEQQPWVSQSSFDGCPKGIRVFRSSLLRTVFPNSTVST